MIGGDCNELIEAGLEWWFDQREGKRGPYLGPTLAYLDPNHLELAWATIETIARFGLTPPAPGAWVRMKGPIELLVLFPTGPLKRRLPQAGKSAASESMCQTVDRLFGSRSWRPIYADQRSGVTTGEPSWIHYVNQYRLQLAGLGYAHTFAIEVRNTRGVVLYHMVFATSSEAGRRIMQAVMDKAREVLPRLLAEERQRLREHPDSPTLFAGQAEFDEMQAISVDPERYAQLVVEPPKPYIPGRPPPVPPEQLGLL